MLPMATENLYLTDSRVEFEPFLDCYTSILEMYYPTRPSGAQLPLTPDSASGYAFRSINHNHDPYGLQQGRHDSTYDYQQGYLGPSTTSAPGAYAYQQSSYQCPSLPPIQSSYYDGVPVLPPLRMNERSLVTEEHQRQHQLEQQNAAAASREQSRQAPKEEKATGGVSAKLDYDMEHMTDFVTEAAQSMYALHQSPICIADIDMTRSFQHQMQSHPSFRKWVHQVLTATRLPSATILLSLHYLNDRLAKHPASIQPGENQIYRLLAVAFILGSKFLDDNTFINRSWSDVTAIKVAELNLLEMKWLGLIQYQLHIEPQCLQAWIDSWKKYDAEYVAKRQAARLSPLDTSVHRSARHADRYCPYPTPQTASTRSFEPSPISARTGQYSSPYSTSDPWRTTSGRQYDYHKGQQPYSGYDLHDESNGYLRYDSYTEAARRASEDHARQVAYAYPTYYDSVSSYGSAWDNQGWSNSHRYDCTCSTCAYSAHYRPYAMASGYTSAQPVMG